MGHPREPAARLPAGNRNRPVRIRPAGAHAAAKAVRSLRPPPAEVPLPASSPLALRNWPVASRLFAVIAAALVIGLVFGGLQVSAAVASAGQFGRISQLARLGQQVTVLAQAMENERDLTAGLVAGDTSPALAARLHAAQAVS